MSILARLSGKETPEMSSHRFWASLVEWTTGGVTRQEVIDTHQISQADEVELDWIKNKIDTASNPVNFMHQLHCLFMLSENNSHNYADQATLTARINAIL